MNPTSEPNISPIRGGSGFFRGLAAALAVVLALAVAATVVSAQTSGDDGDGADDGGAADQGVVDDEAFGAYRDCLAENGIEAPADGERPDRGEITDEQREAFQAAREACADVHPFAEEIAAARACLEENGVELPADGERPDRDEITDEQREAFQAAREACADVLPERGPRGHHGPRPDLDSEEFQAFRACLEENGVEAPADGERPDRDEITDEQREAFQAAREACAEELPFADEIVAFRACLEENGVEAPADGERPDRGEITDEQREAFQAAREACADELPEGAGFGGGPGGHGPRGFGGPGGDGEQPAGFGGIPADGMTNA
jgi:predicted DNA binding protein